MKAHRLPCLFVTPLLAAFIAGGSESLAVTPHSLDATGLVEHLEKIANTFQLRCLKNPIPMLLNWNSLTGFIEDGQFFDAARLREGVPLNAIYYSPFFGKSFGAKVVLDHATAIPTPSFSARLRSCNPSPVQYPIRHP